MRIVFMGSPHFAVPSLELLGNSTHEILAVVTQPDRPRGRNLLPQPPAVKTAAHRLGLPVLQPATTKSVEFLQEMRSLQPDVLVVVAYGEILRPTFLDIPPMGAVNLHVSLLPKYRGAAPVAWAILQGESISGATTILLNEVMDGGSMLLQESCEILPTDTSESLTRRISNPGATHKTVLSVDGVAMNEIGYRQSRSIFRLYFQDIQSCAFSASYAKRLFGHFNHSTWRNRGLMSHSVSEPEF